MGFLFFLFIIGAIVFAVQIWRAKQNQVRTSFSNAATRLGLRISSDGSVLQRPWIYGEIDGFRVDVRPFTRHKNGRQETWTGYRVRFPDSIEVKITGDDESQRQIINRLSKRFGDCEIDSDSLFCARPPLGEDSSRLVSDVEFLIKAAHHLGQPAGLKKADEPEVIPPPLPRSKTKKEKKIEKVVEERLGDSRFKSVDFSTVGQGETDLDEPTILRNQQETEDASPTPPASAEPSEPVAVTPRDTPVASTPPEETAKDDPEPEMAAYRDQPLAGAASDLFDSARNRFEIGQHFDKEYKGTALEGIGILRRVDRYRNDRFFGRGPGFTAEVELPKLENPTGGLSTVTAVVQLPDEESSGISLSHWRERLGHSVLAYGTLTRCDAFAGKIYLTDGLVDAPRAAA